MPAPAIDATAASALKLGVLALIAAPIAGVWELLALQAPGAPLYIGMLPGPIGALRELCITLGLLALAAGVLMPGAYGATSAGRARLASTAMAIGLGLALAAQTYGSALGMHGLQMNDLRPDARAVFFVRHGGLALFALGWLDVGLRFIRRPPAA